MKIGRSVYRRTCWRCWGAALVTTIAVLPGAAVHISAGEEGEALHNPANGQPAMPVIGAPIAGNGDEPRLFVVSYSVNDVLARINDERGLNASDAREFLSKRLKCAVIVPTPASDQHRVPKRIEWSGNDMVIEAGRAGHQQVAEALGAVRRFGATEIAIEIRFVALTAEEVQEALPDWTMAPLDVPEATLATSDAVGLATFDRPLGNQEGTHVARAQLVIEKDSPVRFRIVDKDVGEKLIDPWREDVRSSTLPGPKVTVFSGQTAFVSDTSKTPFVVGLVGPEALQPQIREVSEGTMLCLRPIADRPSSIHLDFAATFSSIQDVETACFNRAPNRQSTVQMPKVATVRIEGGADLMSGQWLVLGGLKPDDQAAKREALPVSWKDWLPGRGNRAKKRETRELVLMLRAERI